MPGRRLVRQQDVRCGTTWLLWLRMMRTLRLTYVSCLLANIRGGLLGEKACRRDSWTLGCVVILVWLVVTRFRVVLN